LPKCQFSVKYDYEIGKEVDFYCQEQDPLASGFCIFHDKDYLQDKMNNVKHKRKVLDRLKHKVNHAISNNEPLLCIGFQLQGFNLSDLSINKEFTKFTMPIYFSGSTFFGEADFSAANFQGEAHFSHAKFEGEGEAHFDNTKFKEVKFVGTKFIKSNFSRAEFIEADFSNADLLN
jgi:uncharacterized protein YjbI with pentapeptide repeats